ncbi:hypothetical protein DLD77_00690 [Chitinophaga alhagiae]|uniref:Leucine-rich repeat domain-containing protein n=1 Tax=Chitinophaga alhagiae TaxID=2203219 RepID=A0ABN5LW04_9BACT|nr:hypothetical protein [Chitinophaga alhagiae]AWO00327.1 hypothetical protein DLD77_00690 [Chitinophaga alhagiae]
MKLKGREKYFWERNFNIKSAAAIPAELKGITGIDSSHDDEFFFFLTARVTTIPEIYLRCTNITDLGVQYICRLQGLRQLTIKDHRHVTKHCLPDINKLGGLEYLDISKNNIAPEDLLTLTGLNNLKELLISSDLPEGELAPLLEKLQAHFPGCEITVY